MKRNLRKSAGAATLVTIGAVLLAGPALAGTKTNVGKVTNDGNSKVTAQVKLKNGEPKLLVKFQVKRLDVECRGDDSEIDFKLVHVRITKQGSKYTFDGFGRDGDSAFSADGTVKKNGKLVEGSIVQQDSMCRGSGTFKASS